MPEPDLPALQDCIPTQMHQVTESELEAFLKCPLDLIDKRFMMSNSGGQHDDSHYEVVNFGVSKGKGHYYGVQFVSCVSAIEMDADEMRALLQESFLING